MRLIGLAIALALALGLTLAPIVAEAQQARKVWRIGVLAPKEGSALAIVTEQHASGLLPLPDAMFNSHRASIIAFAAAEKLVLVASEESWVRDGALMWYGVDSRDHYRHAAAYVDKILKGTKPADLPVEEPTTFRLVINQRTATTLKLIIPPTLRIRADQVIQ